MVCTETCYKEKTARVHSRGLGSLLHTKLRPAPSAPFFSSVKQRHKLSDYSTMKQLHSGSLAPSSGPGGADILGYSSPPDFPLRQQVM